MNPTCHWGDCISVPVSRLGPSPCTGPCPQPAGQANSPSYAYFFWASSLAPPSLLITSSLASFAPWLAPLFVPAANFIAPSFVRSPSCFVFSFAPSKKNSGLSFAPTAPFSPYPSPAHLVVSRGRGEELFQLLLSGGQAGREEGGELGVI